MAEAVRTSWSVCRFLTASLWLLALGGAVGWGVRWAMDPGRFPVRDIEVRGEMTQVDPEAVRARVRALTDGGFLRCDVHAVAAAVESVPWVDKARVRRLWPDRVLAELTEQVPIARWGEDAYLSASGAVFKTRTPVAVPDLPMVTAPQGAITDILARYEDLRWDLAELGLELQRLVVDDRGAWWLHLDGDLVVALGRVDVDARWRRLKGAYQQILAGRPMAIERIDLRYPHGVAIRWREPSEALPGAG